MIRPLTIALMALACVAPARTVIDISLRGDGVRQRIVLDASRERTVTVSQHVRLLWQGVRRALHPWKLLVGDVDGNGTKEILVGVRIKSRRIPWLHNSLYVYGFDGRTVHRRWLGTSLGREFSDFAIGKTGRLYTIELRRDGARCAGVYAWNGFGFAKLSEQGNWRAATSICLHNGVMTVRADGKLVRLKEDTK